VRSAPFCLMENEHPLDRSVWTALTTTQARLAIGNAQARRLLPDYGPFAAPASLSGDGLAAVAALIEPGGTIVMLEPVDVTPPPGTRIVDRIPCVQMTAETIDVDVPRDIVPLTDADAAEMVALAHLTKPGPFHSRTNELGAFVGIKVDGRLVAMAGERLRPRHWVEVSGVCTHPSYRGRGYGAALVRTVAGRIVRRGFKPFLHVAAANLSAIRVYESVGFVSRRGIVATVLVAD
jgi:predicted GNAT family acetyltransferase